MADIQWNWLIIGILLWGAITYKEKLLEMFNYIFQTLPVKIYPTNPVIGISIILAVIGLIWYAIATKD